MGHSNGFLCAIIPEYTRLLFLFVFPPSASTAKIFRAGIPLTAALFLLLPRRFTSLTKKCESISSRKSSWRAA